MTDRSGPAPFGRVLTAMVTPFTASGELDLDRAQQLATRLVDEGNEGLVLNGTTGEAPTTRGTEKAALVRAVVEAVGDRCRVVAGVGSNHTEHSQQMARDAVASGAHGLLVVTPYYNKPPQAGVVAHVEAVAAAAPELPVMLYDIPGRSGIALETPTVQRLAEHPQVVAMKDAKLDLEAASTVLGSTGLAWYSGQDAYTLPMLALGAVGVVGTSTHFTARGTLEMVEAFGKGDVERARELHFRLLPVYTGIFRTQGTILVKAGLRLTGFDPGPVRLPLVEATAQEVEVLRADLAAGGVETS